MTREALNNGAAGEDGDIVGKMLTHWLCQQSKAGFQMRYAKK